MVFLGNEHAIRLCQKYGGLQVPTHDRLYRCLRRRGVVAERLTKSTPVGTLAAKYNVRPASVRRSVTQYHRQPREMKRLNDRLKAARMLREAAS